MTEENQKKLYERFKKLSVDGKDDIQREHAKEYAAQILKSYPKFETKTETHIIKAELKPKPKSKEKE